MALALVIAGRADSLKYAECERLCDIIAASFPSVVLTKTLKHSSEWETYQHRICCENGFPQESAEVLMWMQSGRFIGSNDQCLDFCKTRYGAKLDLSSDDLERYMRENIRLACLAKDQIRAGQLFCKPRALVVLDLQNDFASEGVIGVDAVDQVLPSINRIRRDVEWAIVAFTQIQHRAGDATFDTEGSAVKDTSGSLLFPAHCERGTVGARLHPHLHRHNTDQVIVRGENADIDTYRNFAASFAGSVLDDFFAKLRELKVQDVVVCGLDVSRSIKAAAKLFSDAGFKPFVISDASCRIPRARAPEPKIPPQSDATATTPADGSSSEGNNAAAVANPAPLISIRCDELPRKTQK